MGWRDEQATRTRERIVEVFLELSRGAVAQRVTMAEVSRASGISPATVYRHFRDRQALVDAAASRGIHVGLDDVDGPWTLADLHRHLCALWGALANDLTVVREGAVSAAGRELRSARFRGMRRALESGLGCREKELDAATRSRAAAVLALLSSVHAFLDLHDRQGLDPLEAAATVSWATERILAGLDIDPSEIRFDDVPAGHVSEPEEEQ